MSLTLLKPQNLILGRYQVLRELGMGGMGTVDLVHDLKSRRKVALKRMHDLSTSFRERFRREYRALAAIKNKGVPAIYEIGESETGAPFFTMEIVDGETFQEHMRRGAMAPLRALALAIDLGRVLAAVHDAGIIHRDVKPKSRRPRPKPPAAQTAADLHQTGVLDEAPCRWLSLVAPGCPKAAPKIQRLARSSAVPPAPGAPAARPSSRCHARRRYGAAGPGRGELGPRQLRPCRGGAPALQTSASASGLHLRCGPILGRHATRFEAPHRETRDRVARLRYVIVPGCRGVARATCGGIRRRRVHAADDEKLPRRRHTETAVSPAVARSCRH